MSGDVVIATEGSWVNRIRLGIVKALRSESSEERATKVQGGIWIGHGPSVQGVGGPASGNGAGKEERPPPAQGTLTRVDSYSMLPGRASLVKGFVAVGYLIFV